MTTLEKDLAEAKDEIRRLRVQCDAKDNVIEAHRAFRATVADALAALRAELERKLEVCEEDRSKWANGVRTGVNASLHSLNKTIAKLGLNEPE